MRAHYGSEALKKKIVGIVKEFEGYADTDTNLDEPRDHFGQPPADAQYRPFDDYIS